MTAEELIEAAYKVAGVFTPSEDCTVGGVAAALVTAAGNVYTGICIDTECSLKAHESEIRLIVAVRTDGAIVPPCGRCRELMWQVSPLNAAARVIVGNHDRTVLLSDLLPYPYPK